jgi:hypothetical protein
LLTLVLWHLEQSGFCWRFSGFVVIFGVKHLRRPWSVQAEYGLNVSSGFVEVPGCVLSVGLPHGFTSKNYVYYT